MELGIIISLIVLSAVLFLIEMFLIPGISLAGIAGAISGVAAVVYAYNISHSYGLYTMLALIFLTGLLIWIFIKSKALDKMALKTDINSKVEPLKDMVINVGDEGVAVSRIAPMGKVKVNTHIIEAKINDDFIDSGTAVIVIAVNNNNVTVKRKDI